MSKTDGSFESIRQAIQLLWPEEERLNLAVNATAEMLVLSLPSDVAAFAVLNGHPREDFQQAYSSFKQLYRQNSKSWDARTLSFVLCRLTDRAEDDRFYASLENDPLFCRKYVIRAYESVAAQRDELLRLPFFPIRTPEQGSLQRPRSAQDLLQAAGVPAEFSRDLIESGRRGAEGIASDLRQGRPDLPDRVRQPRAGNLAITKPRATSRLVSLTAEGFRAYRDKQTFDLDASVVVLYGPNGLGKTSFFDALDYASTGRIGRLCRTRRSQAEFSRLATHLDKTPGTGSVDLAVRSGEVGSTETTWNLQRSTGDWSHAWIDGQQVERKTVINRLTQANWVDSTPRQQNLESLFRATHLFGQGEQELLTEFQKGSVIPETFISEMLALQDYSQGISKVGDVISTLADFRASADLDLAQMRAERAELDASIEDAEGPDPHSSAIDGLVSNLRELLLASATTHDPLPESLTSAAYTSWSEVLSARTRALKERIALSERLLAQLPDFRRLAKESAEVQSMIDKFDRQLEEGSKEHAAISRHQENDLQALVALETQQRALEQRRQDLRSVSQAMADIRDLSRQVSNLYTERDKQLLLRVDLDATLLVAESQLSTLLAASAAAQRSVASLRADVAVLVPLIEDLPSFSRDLSVLADVAKSRSSAQAEYQALEERRQRAESALQEARRVRELFLLDYERALSDQADLERLLDSIQGHIHSHSCPLCGSAFDSVSELLARVRQNRESRATHNETTITYQRLLAAESQAAEEHRVLLAEWSEIKRRTDELSTLETGTSERLNRFRVRLPMDLAGVKEPDELNQLLTTRLLQLRERLASSEEAAEAASRDLKELQTVNADNIARRKALQERIGALERDALEPSDRVTRLNSHIERVLSSANEPEQFVKTELAEIDDSLTKTAQSLEQLRASQAGRKQLEADLSGRSDSVTSARKSAVTRLSELGEAISLFRQDLRALDIPIEGDENSLRAVVQQESGKVDALQRAAAKTAVILDVLRTREKRLLSDEKKRQRETLSAKMAATEQLLQNVLGGASLCSSIANLLERERQGAVERHIAAYGPMITLIQQRLRSVYGFGGVQLEATGGEAKVRVEWRSESVQVPPTDFFSDSQRQILMLSIFMAGGLRQNWSGFAPVLLDDPVTHFDDLNAYGFVELVRGIVATAPGEWQFIVSTCEQRLFDLMRQKFSRLSSGANFYEFLGMTDKGPIVERR